VRTSSSFKNALLISAMCLSLFGTAASAQNTQVQSSAPSVVTRTDTSDDQLRQSVDSLVKSRMQQFNIPEEQSAVIALCNLRKPPVYAIATAAARLAFGEPSQQAPENEPGLDQNSGTNED